MNKQANISNQLPDTPNFDWHEGCNQAQLAQLLSDQIEKRISDAIRLRGTAIVAFSGGSTPMPLFEALRDRKINWNKVLVTLVDERWVPIGHDLSNASFLIDNLLSKLDVQPKFVSLFNISANAVDAESSLNSVLKDYCCVTNSPLSAPARFDVAILGMGNDAHTASFFPDADNIKQLVDPNSKQFLLSCSSPSTQVDRVTWSLPKLLDSDFLALHFTGVEKRAVFDLALAANDALNMPIRSALFQTKVKLQVFYAD